MSNNIWDELYDKNEKNPLIFNKIDEAHLDKLWKGKIRYFDFKKGDYVLDLGCGPTGRVAIPCAKRKANVICLDISKRAIENLKKKIKKARLENFCKFMVFDLNNDIPFENDKFNFVISLATVTYVKNIENLIKNISRVSKKDAKIFLTNLRYSYHPLNIIFYSLSWFREKFGMKTIKPRFYLHSINRIIDLFKKIKFRNIRN